MCIGVVVVVAGSVFTVSGVHAQSQSLFTHARTHARTNEAAETRAFVSIKHRQKTVIRQNRQALVNFVLALALARLRS